MDELKKDKIIHKVLAYMSAIALILGLLLVSLLIGWSIYPYKTIDFKSDYKTEKLEYIQGEQTYYVIDYCKYTDVFPVLTKKFIDGIEFTAEANRAILTKGCRKELVSLLIPYSLPEGRYRLQITLDYKMNPIRVVRKTAYSNWFVVKQNPNRDIDNYIKNGDN